MNGTTLCPHCNTRFRIAGEQLEAHQGMVRCGHCMQAFDARPGFIPDQPDPQLELPIVDQRAGPAAPPPSEPAVTAPVEPTPVALLELEATSQPEESQQQEQAPEESKPEEPQAEVQGAAELEAQGTELPEPEKEQAAAGEVQTEEETPHDGSLDFVPPVETSSDESPSKPLVIQPPLLAGLDVEEEVAEEIPQPGRRWPWIAGALLLALLMLLQGLYFFRVELAVRLPGLKPMLVGYCKLLACTVPLPQNVDLMSIESSELQADLQHANQITLIALLRNRATHVQAFPVLELSLNDTEDKVLARRLFKPADYLPATESEEAGLRPNRELSIRLKLDTTDLRPTGYRLALFYPQ